MIVLRGGVIEAEDYPKQRLEELIAANAPFEKTGLAMDLRWAQLGWVSTLHGAPKIVLDHVSGGRDARDPHAAGAT